jgi:hypothetical protein
MPTPARIREFSPGVENGARWLRRFPIQLAHRDVPISGIHTQRRSAQAFQAQHAAFFSDESLPRKSPIPAPWQDLPSRKKSAHAPADVVLMRCALFLEGSQ